jgi:DNA-binding transcriptional regulator YiaG
MTSRKHFFIKGRAPSTEPLHYRQCGLDNVFLLNGFDRETMDGEEHITIHSLDGLWKAIGLHIVLRQKTLAPQEVRFLRQQMDLTQAELAKMLRVTDQTVARWEKGDTAVNGTADFALRTAFLLSPTSQPEGKKILEELLQHIQQLTDTDEDRAAKTVFARKGRQWKEVRSRAA